MFSVLVFGFKGFYQQRARQRPRQIGGACRRPRQRLEEPQGLGAQKTAQKNAYERTGLVKLPSPLTWRGNLYETPASKP